MVELVAVHTWISHADFYVDVAWDAVATQAEEALAQRLAGWSDRYPEVIVRRVVGQDNPVSRLLEGVRGGRSCWSWVSWAGQFRRAFAGFGAPALAQAARIPVIAAR